MSWIESRTNHFSRGLKLEIPFRVCIFPKSDLWRWASCKCWRRFEAYRGQRQIRLQKTRSTWQENTYVLRAWFYLDSWSHYKTGLMEMLHYFPTRGVKKLPIVRSIFQIVTLVMATLILLRVFPLVAKVIIVLGASLRTLWWLALLIGLGITLSWLLKRNSKGKKK